MSEFRELIKKWSTKNLINILSLLVLELSQRLVAGTVEFKDKKTKGVDKIG